MPQPIDPHQPNPAPPRAISQRFTNRVDETAQFLERLNAPERGPDAQRSPLPTLMFYGVGGAGKTTLLEHLQGCCDAYRVPWAGVNLALTPGFLEALPKLAHDLYRRHGLRMPNFERVLAVLTAKEAGQAIKKALGASTGVLGRVVGIARDQAPEVLTKGIGAAPDRLKELDDALAGVVSPLLGHALELVIDLVPMAKLGGAALSAGLDRAMQHKPFRDAALRLGGQHELLRLLEASEDHLRLELQRCFAADLERALPDRPGPVGRGALFFDQHEFLWRDGRGGAASQDGWIRHLCQLLHDRGVLIVIAGRDALGWGEDWRETDASGRRLWLEERVVGGLSHRDALEFLRRADAPDGPAQLEHSTMPAALQDAILAATDESVDGEGAHHCYLLSLCAEIVSNARQRTGAYPDPSAFDAIPEGEASARLVERFLLSLESQSTVGWLEELALTPRFDEDYALALDDARHHHNGRAGWEHLTRLSLLHAVDGGFFEMHRLLRDALRERVRPSVAREVHAWSASHWNAAPEADEVRRGLGWYHARFTDHAEAIRVYNARLEAASTQAHATTLRAMASWWTDVPLEAHPRTPDQARDLQVYATTLQKLPSGQPSANLHQAIARLLAALEFYTEARFPPTWAMIQTELGACFWFMPTGERDENLRRAIAYLEAALRVRTEREHPLERARTLNRLGLAYWSLSSGERTENLERAIGCYESALPLCADRERDDWAAIQNNLGIAYLDRPDGDRVAALERARSCFEAALGVHTRSSHPHDWAYLQNNLGNTYRDLPSSDRATNLRVAMAHYQAALEIHHREAFPRDWANVQQSMGVAHRVAAGLGDTARLEASIACLRAALEVFTESEFPGDWADTQLELARSLVAQLDPRNARSAFESAMRGYRLIGAEARARTVETELSGSPISFRA
jgi:tetratricopeptide (TPR) repeat protein